jgi:hypothetical protein
LHDDLGAYPSQADDAHFNGLHTQVDPKTNELYDVQPQGIFKNMTEVPGTRRPMDYVYRAVSDADWQGIQSKGYMQSDERMNLANEGTVAKPLEPAPFYLPQTGVGHVLKVEVQPQDNWKIDTDGYAKTHERIPLERVKGVSTFKDQLATKTYDPSEPRDDAGKWTAGGSLSPPEPMQTPAGSNAYPGSPAAGDAAAAGLERQADEALNDPNKSRDEYKARIAAELGNRLSSNDVFARYAIDQQVGHFVREAGLTYDSDAAIHQMSDSERKDIVTKASSDLVQNWASSSGDTVAPSVAMQMAIKDEFGLKDAATDHLHQADSYYKGLPGQNVRELYEQSGPAYRAFARAMYDNTQADLKAKGITEMTLYRGLSFPNAVGVQPSPREPDPGTGLLFDGKPHEVTTTEQPA